MNTSLPLIRRKRPYRFEVRKKPRCEKCGGTMRISRRKPHPVLGDAWELQQFTCVTCHHVQEQAAGENRPADALD
jgi:hypothetical protein